MFIFFFRFISFIIINLIICAILEQELFIVNFKILHVYCRFDVFIVYWGRFEVFIVIRCIIINLIIREKSLCQYLFFDWIALSSENKIKQYFLSLYLSSFQITYRSFTLVSPIISSTTFTDFLD